MLLWPTLMGAGSLKVCGVFWEGPDQVSEQVLVEEKQLGGGEGWDQVGGSKGILAKERPGRTGPDCSLQSLWWDKLAANRKICPFQRVCAETEGIQEPLSSSIQASSCSPSVSSL